MNPKEILTKLKGGLKKLFKGKRKFAVIAVILIVAIGATCFAIFGKKGDSEEKSKYTTFSAQQGDITETIEQSGVVEPYERREITSLVKGEIIVSNYEEGDYVEEGATLYQIDDEDAQLQIEKAENSIEKANISLNETNKDISNLNIYAPASGTLSGFDLKAGENVQNGVIGYITNTDTLTVSIPFTAADYNKISVGDGATLTSSLYMTSFSGKVTHKYNSASGTANDGSQLKNVEFEFSNPGAVSEGATLAAKVNTSSGTVNSSGSGKVENGSKTEVYCEVQGSKASSVKVKNGDSVKKGQLIATLSNDSLYSTKKNGELSLKDSKLSLESNKKTLEDYNITAPISGTVITKTSKLGDKIDNSNSQTVMMVIADMSKMKFTISVDELDIAKIQIGQKAIVDADAIDGESFEGRVNSVASEGTSTGDGVTTYEVEIVIDEPGDLKSGMNVNANIVINEALDVVYIPEEAIMGKNGTKAMVLVKSENGKKSDKTDKSNQNVSEDKNAPADMPENGEPPKGEAPSGEMPKDGAPNGGEMPNGDMPQGEAANKKSADSENAAKAGGAKGGANIPDGYEMRAVEVGISDGTNIEITSGLSVGEEIIYIASTASSDNGLQMGGMPGMGGGMPGGGGGMPGGGGAPGGGNRGGGGGMPGGR